MTPSFFSDPNENKVRFDIGNAIAKGDDAKFTISSADNPLMVYKLKGPTRVVLDTSSADTTPLTWYVDQRNYQQGAVNVRYLISATFNGGALTDEEQAALDAINNNEDLVVAKTDVKEMTVDVKDVMKRIGTYSFTVEAMEELDKFYIGKASADTPDTTTGQVGQITDLTIESIYDASYVETNVIVSWKDGKNEDATHYEVLLYDADPAGDPAPEPIKDYGTQTIKGFSVIPEGANDTTSLDIFNEVQNPGEYWISIRAISTNVNHVDQAPVIQKIVRLSPADAASLALTDNRNDTEPTNRYVLSWNVDTEGVNAETPSYEVYSKDADGVFTLISENRANANERSLWDDLEDENGRTNTYYIRQLGDETEFILSSAQISQDVSRLANPTGFKVVPVDPDAVYATPTEYKDYYVTWTLDANAETYTFENLSTLSQSHGIANQWLLTGTQYNAIKGNAETGVSYYVKAIGDLEKFKLDSNNNNVSVKKRSVVANIQAQVTDNTYVVTWDSLTAVYGTGPAYQILIYGYTDAEKTTPFADGAVQIISEIGGAPILDAQAEAGVDIASYMYNKVGYYDIYVIGAADYDPNCIIGSDLSNSFKAAPQDNIYNPSITHTTGNVLLGAGDFDLTQTLIAPDSVDLTTGAYSTDTVILSFDASKVDIANAGREYVFTNKTDSTAQPITATADEYGQISVDISAWVANAGTIEIEVIAKQMTASEVDSLPVTITVTRMGEPENFTVRDTGSYAYELAWSSENTAELLYQIGGHDTLNNPIAEADNNTAKRTITSDVANTGIAQYEIYTSFNGTAAEGEYYIDSHTAYRPVVRLAQPSAVIATTDWANDVYGLTWTGDVNAISYMINNANSGSTDTAYTFKTSNTVDNSIINNIKNGTKSGPTQYKLQSKGNVTTNAGANFIIDSAETTYNVYTQAAPQITKIENAKFAFPADATVSNNYQTMLHITTSQLYMRRQTQSLPKLRPA